jgi:hypothetical protein
MLTECASPGYLRRRPQPRDAAMPKSNAPESATDDEWAKLSQHEKFIRTARELECDESGEAYRRALRVILPPRKPGEPAPKATEQPAPKGSRRASGERKSEG